MKLRYEPALSPLWFALSLVAACDSVRLPRFGEHPKRSLSSSSSTKPTTKIYTRVIHGSPELRPASHEPPAPPRADSALAPLLPEAPASDHQ